MGARPDVALLVAVVAAALAACGSGSEPQPERATFVATTTIEDSGLLDTLSSAFHARHPEVRLRVLTAGTGQALRYGRAGDADVLLTHAPEAESAFVAAGHGVQRWPLMHNDFVIAGPPADPAGVRGLRDVIHALRRIRDAAAPFVSRGDDSGTHRKERALWAALDSAAAAEIIGPDGSAASGPATSEGTPGRASTSGTAGLGQDGAPADGYIEAGVGMGAALRTASQRGAYILTDRATFMNYRSGLELVLLVEGDSRLYNEYGLILGRHAAESEAAGALVDWLRSSEARRLIAGYGAQQFDRPLFTPDTR